MSWVKGYFIRPDGSLAWIEVMQVSDFELLAGCKNSPEIHFFATQCAAMGIKTGAA